MKIILIFVMSSISLFAQFGGGGPGTDKDNAYEIWTIEDLIEFGDSVSRKPDPSIGEFYNWHFGKHFRLMEDIDGVTQPIGWYDLQGHFHGSGKKITVDMNEGYALFSSVTFGTIDSLIVDGISGVVGITGYNSGNISNCINNSTIYYSGLINPITGKLEGPAGGITYSNSGTISNCINNGDITGVDRIGGIAGENSGTIINCINTGKITATASGDNDIFSGVGGIVGTVANHCQNISNCINLGSVVGQGFVGGIVGLANGNPMAVTPITNCINYGYVRGTNIVSGVLGYMFNPQGVNVSNCVNVGVVEGEEDIGSIVGKE